MKNNKSREYWQRRAESIAAEQHLKAEELIKRLQVEYENAMLSIQKDINSFYQRYASNNQIELAEARRMLDSKEVRQFKMELKEFIRLAKNNPDNIWTQTLNNEYFKIRISRLEALKLQIENAMQVVNVNQNDKMTNLLGTAYSDTYYRTVYEVQKGLNIGTTFAKVDTKTVERVLSKPWLEDNYSTRIWKENKKLVRVLQQELAQGIIRGDSSDKIAKMVEEKMGRGYRNAQRLVRTEMGHIQNEASFAGYKAGRVVQKYQFLATLDGRTSHICRDLDGEIFTLAEKEEGVNFPSMHPNCRSTTVAFFEDEEEVGERIARLGDKTYYVPGNMKYEDWYNSLSEDEQGIMKLDAKKSQNINNDSVQHEKYKLIFGNKIPSKLEDFQELKYNNIKEWENIKAKKQDTLNSLYYRDSLYGKLGNKEVREWYVHKCSNISNVIDKSKDIKEQAMESYSLRNKYKTEARLMMKNRKEAERLNSEEALKTFEQLVDSKVKHKKLSVEEVYKDIINSSSTTRKSVNEKYGVD